LSKTDQVAGVGAEVARAVARAARPGQVWVERIAQAAKVTVPEARAAAEALADSGYLAEVRDDGEVLWQATSEGLALAMASFQRPVSRAKAELLVAGLMGRAAAWNADPGKAVWIDRLRIFGSYLTDAPALGDVDVAVELNRRARFEDRGQWAAYVNRSGRVFANLVERVAWPQTEAVQHLRNRSGYLSLHLEEIARYTDKWLVAYQRRLSPGEAPPADPGLFQVPASLAALRGPKTGMLEVPEAVGWAPRRKVDLSNPLMLEAFYQAVVVNAPASVQQAALNEANLRRAWHSLVLPGPCRALWETRFPELLASPSAPV
jgi:hypothetical protein